MAILVIAQNAAQVASENDYLLKNGVTLVTQENLLEAIQTLQFPKDPDSLFESAKNVLVNKSRALQR